jgi:molecular chaperone DnaJ
VEVVVAEDERFERHGQDLVTVTRLPATRAMLGGTISVPTLDGDREVEIPAGAQPGEHVLIRGAGLPSLRGAARGDQHVVLDVVVPVDLDPDQRELTARLDDSLVDANLRRDGRGGRWRRFGARRRARRQRA